MDGEVRRNGKQTGSERMSKTVQMIFNEENGKLTASSHDRRITDYMR